MSVRKKLVKRSLSSLFAKHLSHELVAGDAVESVESVLNELNDIFLRHDAVHDQLSKDASLHQVMGAVSLWQRERLESTYQSLLVHPALGEASNFVLNHAYAGPNQVELMAAVKRVVNSSASKIFPLPLLRTAADILILNTVTYELDLTLSQALIHRGYCGQYELSHALYEEVFCLDLASRVDQLSLLSGMGTSIDRYLGSQWVFAAFQLAQIPARKMGFGVLVDFMKPGFEAMRNLPVPAQSVLDIIINTEKHCLSKFHAGERQVYANVRLDRSLKLDNSLLISDPLAS